MIFLLTSRQFLAGLVLGGIAAALLLWRWWRLRRVAGRLRGGTDVVRERVGTSGSAVGAAAVVALVVLGLADRWLLVAVAAFAVAAWLSAYPGVPGPTGRWARAAGLVVWLEVAAWLVGGAAVTYAGYLPRLGKVLVAVAVAVAGRAVLRFDRTSPVSHLGALLFAVSAFGVYTTVPDTEAARALVGAALPIGGLVLLLRTPLGLVGAPLVVAVLAWTAVDGGAVRQGSIVGGLACLGVLVVEPVGRLLAGPRGGLAEWRGRWGEVAVFAVHTAAVGVCARVAGLRESAVEAGVLVAAALAVTIGLLTAPAMWEAWRGAD